MDDLTQLAFDAAPIGLVLTEQRVIYSCNTTFCEMFGYKASDLIGQSFRKLYATEGEFHRIRDIGLEPLMRAKDYSDERIMRHADGAPIWCRFRAHTLTPDNPLARIVMSFALMVTNTSRPQLTPRERDVVGWLSRGMTSKEIAHALSLSPRTVEDHRSRLLRKFSAKNAADLLSKLTDLGQ